MMQIVAAFLPLALVAIAPVMVGVIVLLLGLEGGLGKAFSFLAARVIGYAMWGMAFLFLGEKLAVSDQGGASTTSLAIKLILGILLLVMAAKSYFAEEDPDAPPPKWISTLNGASNGAIFGIGLLLTLLQIRFVLLMWVGVDAIAEAQLSAGAMVAALVALIIVVLWPQLTPFFLYLVARRKVEGLLNDINAWLQAHSRAVNVAILGIFGLKLLWDGLIGLGILG